jgi:[ribosomal protein S18]-alanine N-acetyltransferase
MLEALHAQGFPAPWQAKEFETLLKQPGAAGWIAANENAALGFILVRAAADEAEILTVVVDPAQRRKGIAAQLLNSAAAALRAGTVRNLFLEVAADNVAALALYKSYGFEPCGRRPDYYRVAPHRSSIDAIVMNAVL